MFQGCQVRHLHLVSRQQLKCGRSILIDLEDIAENISRIVFARNVQQEPLRYIEMWRLHELDMPDKGLPGTPLNDTSCSVYTSRLHQPHACTPLTLKAI